MDLSRQSVAIDTAEEKQQVHQLVDRLAPIQVAAVRHLLETMVYPIDDEPLTPEEIEALDESARSRKHEKTTTHEEFLAELGITK